MEQEISQPAEGDDRRNGEEGGAPALALLRERPENVHVLRGFGPLVVGVLLFLLMVLLVPSVAPEQVIERPKGSDASSQGDDDSVTTSSTSDASSTSTSAP